ncbi:eukaryotic translation initiation factor [Salix suchowensis]|nr:eukaryotic translation initiation factor [Salix suchowensis]
MAEYDLSKTIIPYLDRHLTFPILAHLAETELFPESEVQIANSSWRKEPTCSPMLRVCSPKYTQMRKCQQTEFDEKRENAVSVNERLQQEAQAVLDVIENPNLIHVDFAKGDDLQLTLDQIRALYTFGQYQFSYGNYSGAADYLYHFRVLSTDNDLNTSAHWGKLASDILTGKWDVALEELNSLRDVVDSRQAPPLLPNSSTNASEPALTQLHSRSWLLHWSLFVYFNHEQVRVQPRLFSRRNAIREVVRVIQMEEYQFQDPVTSFLKELYVVGNDFFLQEFKDDFMDNARYLISEAYCRYTNASTLGKPPQPIYQSVIEKTRGLSIRTQALGQLCHELAALLHRIPKVNRRR